MLPGRKREAESPPGQRLSLVWNEIQKEYDAQRPTTRLTNLKLSMVCDPAKPHQDWAILVCKGAETKHFMPALLPVLKKILDVEEEHHQKMVAALSAMVDLIHLFDCSGMFLDKRTYNKAKTLGKAFFNNYAWLNEWAATEDRRLFHITMKCHTCSHLIKNCREMNPRCCWNFRAEDFVGRISTLGASVMHGVKSTKLCHKINARYHVLLHLQMQRLGYEVVETEPEP